jgi:hypothetical protein
VRWSFSTIGMSNMRRSKKGPEETDMLEPRSDGSVSVRGDMLIPIGPGVVQDHDQAMGKP